MIIGVSGSRYGITPQQELTFRRLLWQEVEYRNLDRDAREKDQFHHGAAVGVDEKTATIAKNEFGLWTVAHPTYMTSWTTSFESDVTLKPLQPLRRNMDIVYTVQLLFALPLTRHEVLRSGTWATIRAARSKRLKGIIIYPDGQDECL